MNRAATHPPTKPTYRAFHAVALAGLLTLVFINPATAADFPGSLKGATITDAQATNQPPVATFSYNIAGDTVNLDASDSTDSDGAITSYKWDLGNGTTVNGPTAQLKLDEKNDIAITLTVADNNKGISIIKKTLSIKIINDGFMEDTSTNYSSIENNFYINEGAAHGKPWSSTKVYNNTNINNINQTVEALLTHNQSNTDTSGFLFRFDPDNQIGYIIYFEYGTLRLGKISGKNLTQITSVQNVKNNVIINATINNDHILVYVDGIEKINIKDKSYTTGNYAGLYFYRGHGNTDVIIDNFKARSN